MTWIIGMPTMFGHAIAISDVRISDPTGTLSEDCLQKVHIVGRDIVLGFAGSVTIGFRMVSALASLLSQCPPDQAWDPETVADWWPADARSIFDASSDEEKEGGCHLMMISAHPNKNLGDIGWPQTYVHLFRAPDFVATRAQPHEAVSIGFGAVEPTCVDALRRLTADEDAKFSLMQAAVAVPGGLAMVLGNEISRHISDASPSGISPHLNLAFVTRGQVNIANNDYTRFEDGGPVEFRMPRLARSATELDEILRCRGIRPAQCQASA